MFRAVKFLYVEELSLVLNNNTNLHALQLL